MLKKLIKKWIPKPIYAKYVQFRQHQLKIKIVNYLNQSSEFDVTEKNEIVDYFANNPLSAFPYDFTKKYNPKDVIVHTDHETMMKYVWHENKRLYFKKSWSEEEVQNYYNSVLQEQDIDSPHRYETIGFQMKYNDTVVDVGVAEGNFSLSVVEKAKKLYLFEADEEWIDALKLTFAPWKDKVEIVCKYVSDNNEGDCITLDTFLGKEKVDFIKADVEGSEKSLLKGSQKILSDTENLRVIMCTYHNQNDAEEINMILKESNFSTEFSKGYMIFLCEKVFSAPFLRKGLIRGTKL